MAIYVNNATAATRIYSISGKSATCVVVARDGNLNPSGAEGTHWFIPWATNNGWCISTCSLDSTWYDSLKSCSCEWYTGLATSVQCTSDTGCTGNGWETVAQRYGKAISGFPALNCNRDCFCVPASCNLCRCHNSTSMNMWPYDESFTDCGFGDYVQMVGRKNGDNGALVSFMCVPTTRFVFQTCNNCFKFMAVAPVCSPYLTTNCWSQIGDHPHAHMIGICCPGRPERFNISLNNNYGITALVPDCAVAGAKEIYISNSSCTRFVYDFNNGNEFYTKCGCVRITSNYHGGNKVCAVLYCSASDSDNCEWYSTYGCDCSLSCAWNFGPNTIGVNGVSGAVSCTTSGVIGRQQNASVAMPYTNSYNKNSWERSCLCTCNSVDGTGYLLTYVSPWIATSKNNISFPTAYEIVSTISRAGGMWWYNSTYACSCLYTCSTAAGCASGGVVGCTFTQSDVCFSWNCSSTYCLCVAHPYKVICGYAEEVK